MADICADRNQAVTDGFAAFAGGHLRQPPAKLVDRELYRLWCDGWDNAAVTLQQHQQAHRALIEQQSEILFLLVEGAALARGYESMAKTSVRDKGRCRQLIGSVEKFEKQMGRKHAS